MCWSLSQFSGKEFLKHLEFPEYQEHYLIFITRPFQLLDLSLSESGNSWLGPKELRDEASRERPICD